MGEKMLGGGCRWAESTERMIGVREVAGSGLRNDDSAADVGRIRGRRGDATALGRFSSHWRKPHIGIGTLAVFKGGYPSG
jgi:hypothetical protein